MWPTSDISNTTKSTVHLLLGLMLLCDVQVVQTEHRYMCTGIMTFVFIGWKTMTQYDALCSTISCLCSVWTKDAFLLLWIKRAVDKHSKLKHYWELWEFWFHVFTSALFAQELERAPCWWSLILTVIVRKKSSCLPLCGYCFLFTSSFHFQFHLLI